MVSRCPQCGRRFHVAAEHLGKRARCPHCREIFEIRLAAAAGPRDAPAPTPAGLCPICQTAIGPNQATADCPDCKSHYHLECWEHNKGCAVYGCPQVPPTEGLESLEIPPSYWGREEKDCPNCAQPMKAAALRCRHCGATFDSAKPQDVSEFRQRHRRKVDQPALRRTCILLLIFGVLSCTAPFAAMFGLAWYLSRRKAVETLPSPYPALCKIAVSVALVQTTVIVLITILYAVFGH